MIKILRLKNGDDIIGEIVEENNVTIIEPMVIYIDYQSKLPKLAMEHWLPVQLIAENMITIPASEILGVMEPNDNLLEYYQNTIDQMNSVLRTKEIVDEMTDEEIVESIIAMRELQEETIH